MLSIKKRNPRRNLFLYGGGAFIAGFAGIMSLLVINNSNIGEYVAQTPIQQSQPSTVNEQSTKSDDTKQSETTDVDGAMNIGTTSVGSSWSAPAVNQNPSSTTQPTQNTTQPTSPSAPATTPEAKPTEPSTEPTLPIEVPTLPEVLPVDPDPAPEETKHGLVNGLLNTLGL